MRTATHNVDWLDWRELDLTGPTVRIILHPRALRYVARAKVLPKSIKEKIRKRLRYRAKRRIKRREAAMIRLEGMGV